MAGKFEGGNFELRNVVECYRSSFLLRLKMRKYYKNDVLFKFVYKDIFINV